MLNIQDKGNSVIEISSEDRVKDVLHVCTHLRAADFDEVFDVTGESPHITILEGWDIALRRWIIYNCNGVAVAVLGVRPIEPFSKIGIVWLLGTDDLDNMSKFFLKISKPIIEEMKKGFDIICGYVDSRYEKSKRWLSWCGFTIIDEPIQFGINRLPFHEFYMEVS